MHSLSYIGTKELPRNAMKRHKLREILEVDVRQESNDDGTSLDGIYMFLVNGFRIPIFDMEFKREFGDGASDPSTQVGLSMRRAWIQKTVSFTFYWYLLVFNFNFFPFSKRKYARSPVALP
jgi:hypothetical protein